MAFRILKTDPFQNIMYANQLAISMNRNVSHIMTPMRNTDIKRAEKENDWTELLEKAKIQTNRFRREFYR
jgi:hypothetical protein